MSSDLRTFLLCKAGHVEANALIQPARTEHLRSMKGTVGTFLHFAFDVCIEQTRGVSV